MNAAKRHGLLGPIRSMFGRMSSSDSGRTGLIIFLIAIGFVTASVWAWRKWGSEIISGSSYAILPENIEITPPPDWIKVDVKTEAIRDGALAELQITDRQITSKVANAFALHPWVADVKRSVKRGFPPRVIVDIQYRQPVVMVEVITNTQRGFLAVDGEGILLPKDDFTSNDVRSYLRLSVGSTKPIGQAGTSWGDNRVTDGAKIAAAWKAHWKTLGLYRIVEVESSIEKKGSQTRQYDIVTRNGSRVLWGSPPGNEISGEATADKKVARLLQYAKQHGSLDSAGGGITIDARRNEALSVSPRTANLPNSGSR